MAVLNEIPRTERVEREPVNLSNGGVITVILGPGGDLPTDYGLHPKVRPIDGRIIDPRDPSQRIPANTKAVIFGGGDRLDRKVFEAVHEYLKRRRILYVLAKNDEHLKQTLISMVPAEKPAEPEKPTTPEEKAAAEQRQIAQRGSIKTFIAKHMPDLLKQDPVMPAAECARQLFRLAQDAGITTTLLSLQQGVRLYKKDRRVGERPPSVQTDEQKALTGIDEAIQMAEGMVAALKRARDYFVAREQEHVKTSKHLAALKDILGAFKDEAGL